LRSPCVNRMRLNGPNQFPNLEDLPEVGRAHRRQLPPSWKNIESLSPIPVHHQPPRLLTESDPMNLNIRSLAHFRKKSLEPCKGMPLPLKRGQSGNDPHWCFGKNYNSAFVHNGNHS